MCRDQQLWPQVFAAAAGAATVRQDLTPKELSLLLWNASQRGGLHVRAQRRGSAGLGGSGGGSTSSGSRFGVGDVSSGGARDNSYVDGCSNRKTSTECGVGDLSSVGASDKSYVDGSSNRKTSTEGGAGDVSRSGDGDNGALSASSEREADSSCDSLELESRSSTDSDEGSSDDVVGDSNWEDGREAQHGALLLASSSSSSRLDGGSDSEDSSEDASVDSNWKNGREVQADTSDGHSPPSHNIASQVGVVPISVPCPLICLTLNNSPFLFSAAP